MKIRLMKWNDISIKIKLIILCFLLILTPVFVLGYYLTNRLESILIHNMENSNQTSIERISSDFSQQLNSYGDILDSLVVDQKLSYFLLTNFHSNAQAYEYSNSNLSTLFKLPSYWDKKMMLKLLTPNRSVNFGNIYNNPIHLSIKNIDYIMQAWKPGERIRWCGINKIFEDEYLVLQVRIGDYSNQNNTIGSLFLYIEKTSIPFTRKTESNPDYLIFLRDNNNNELLSNTDIKADLSPSMYKNITISGIKYSVLTYTLNNKRMNINNWSFYYLIPIAPIKKNVLDIWRTTLILVFISTVLSYIFLELWSRNIIKRINNILFHMKKLKSGDTKVRIGTNEKDEIGSISIMLDEMSEKIDYLISKVLISKINIQNAEIERQKLEVSQKNSQFLALQRQINPHYLFNTLETIRMGALIEGSKATSKIIEIFARSFKETMVSNNNHVKIEHELKILEDFFAIQKYRFEDNLDYNINCEEDLKQYLIPSFTIQPIVENSVYHGRKHSKVKTIINIDIYRDQDCFIVINVSDNGVGIDKESLEKLLCSIKSFDTSNNSKNIALSSIYHRLKLLYSDSFSFEIKSSEAQGTSVTIRIPYKEINNV